MMRFFWLAFITNFRRLFVIKLSFAVNLLIATIKQALFLLSWFFFFKNHGSVNGWDFNDLLILNGLFCIGTGISEIFFFGVREIPKMVEFSQLDSYIIQPKNIILNIAMSKGRISSLGDLVSGLALIIVAKPPLIPFLLMVPLSTLFMFSLFLYLSSISFFIQNASEFIRELYVNSVIVSSQPNSAYKGLLKIFTYTLLPVAYFSFFPVEFIKNGHFMDFAMAYLGTCAFFIISVIFFYKGLQRYESGNMVGKKT